MVGFVTPTILAFGVSEAVATQIVSIITAGGVLIAYIIGEGIVDAAREKSKTNEKEGE